MSFVGAKLLWFSITFHFRHVHMCVYAVLLLACLLPSCRHRQFYYIFNPFCSLTHTRKIVCSLIYLSYLTSQAINVKFELDKLSKSTVGSFNGHELRLSDDDDCDVHEMRIG